MKYRHIKTGAVIDISSTLIDKDWEPFSAPGPAPKETTAPARKAEPKKAAPKRTGKK